MKKKDSYYISEVDILSLGFIANNNISENRYIIIKWIKNNIEIGYWRDKYSKDMEYSIFNRKRNIYCFIGKIRNKTELSKILNMISV